MFLSPDILHSVVRLASQTPSGLSSTDVTNAITQALVQGGQTWFISTIVAFLPVLWTAALMLHLGRPYVVRTLRRCGLRLGADVWWMSYLLVRDGAMLVTFGLSWIFFEPNIVAGSALPLTGSLATLSLLIALAIKITRPTDDNVQGYRLVTAFLVLGATLYYGPQVFAVEATSQPALTNFMNFFTTSFNVNDALFLMWVSIAGAVLVLGYVFMYALNRVSTKTTKTTLPTLAQTGKGM